MADLSHADLTGDHDDAALLVRVTKNRSAYPARYRSAIEGRNLGPIIKALGETAWLHVAKGSNPAYIPAEERAGTARLTCVTPGPKLVEWWANNPVQLSDLQLLPGGEAILLKSERDPYSRKKTLIDYEDTTETRVRRSEVERINDWLRTIPLHCPIDGVDVADRDVQRIFNNGRFDHGGRLFGGFWQSLPKRDRASLRICREPVATLDYGQAFARMLYAREGVTPPTGDLYALPVYGSSARTGVKRIFSSLVFGKEDLKRFPKKEPDGPQLRTYFPKGTTFSQVVREMQRHHVAIGHYLPSKIGHELFFQESEILLTVLERCQSASLSALPLHDAILVPTSRALTARLIMERVFREKTGGEAVVTVTCSNPSMYPSPSSSLGAT